MLAARWEKAPRCERLRVEELVPLVLVVCGEDELEVAASVGASPGACAAGRPVTAGMPYASSAPARRGTLASGCRGSVGPLLVTVSGSVGGGLAIALAKRTMRVGWAYKRVRGWGSKGDWELLGSFSTSATTAGNQYFPTFYS